MEDPFIFPVVVQFVDTDAAGVVHFTKILQYVEAAEHAALQAKGVEVFSKEGGFPKVHVACDYKHPLRYGETVQITLNLVSKGNKALHWGFKIHTSDAGKLCAEGEFTTVYINAQGQSAALPSDFLA